MSFILFFVDSNGGCSSSKPTYCFLHLYEKALPILCFDWCSFLRKHHISHTRSIVVLLNIFQSIMPLRSHRTSHKTLLYCVLLIASTPICSFNASFKYPKKSCTKYTVTTNTIKTCTVSHVIPTDHPINSNNTHAYHANNVITTIFGGCHWPITILLYNLSFLEIHVLAYIICVVGT